MITVSAERINELECYVTDAIVSAKERGCNPVDIDDISNHFEDLKKNNAPDRWRYYETILDILCDMEVQEGFPYDEPSDVNEILSKAYEIRDISDPEKLSDKKLKDKIYGAWIGRCAGCMLGKPIEGRNRKYIRKLLESVNEYPLKDYFPEIKKLPEGCEDYKPDSRLIKGNITCGVRDDDTDYPIINLYIAKRFGINFSSENVAEVWTDRFPFNMVYTAERVAYRNFVNGIMPPHSAFYRNPYREWIGAQIRADLWGWIFPGYPKRAADIAFRDASISHMSNGIYGEMYFAAAISAAFITNDIDNIIKSSLFVVPAKSRFAEMVFDCLEIHKKNQTWESAIEEFMEKYGRYHVIHTIKNAGIVLLALLFGEGDFEKTICCAVMGGEDTDCNGATAGSLMGVLLGANKIHRKWSDCLNDTLESIVIGFNKSKISELASETFKIAKQNILNTKEK